MLNSLVNLIFESSHLEFKSIPIEIEIFIQKLKLKLK